MWKLKCQQISFVAINSENWRSKKCIHKWNILFKFITPVMSVAHSIRRGTAAEQMEIHETFVFVTEKNCSGKRRALKQNCAQRDSIPAVHWCNNWIRCSMYVKTNRTTIPHTHVYLHSVRGLCLLCVCYCFIIVISNNLFSFGVHLLYHCTRVSSSAEHQHCTASQHKKLNDEVFLLCLCLFVRLSICSYFIFLLPIV